LELFKLFGTILIDNDPANRKLQETDAQAEKVGNTLTRVAATAAKWGAAIAAGATAAGGALFALSKRVADTAGYIDDVTQKMGIGTTAFQEYQYAAEQLGISQNQMEKALGRLNQRLGMAERGNVKYAEALRELGVTSRDTDEAFVQAIESLHRMEDSQKQAALAADLFGVMLARDLMPAIQAGGEELLNLRNRAHQLGKVMSEETVQAGASFGDALTDIQTILGGIAQDIAAKVLPTFAKWLTWIAENLPKAWAVFQFLGEVIEIVVRHTSKALRPWVDLIRSILGVAWDWTINILGDAWKWLTTTTWAEKWEDIKGWLTAGWNWLVNIGGSAWAWLTETTWAQKIEDVRRWLSSAWSWVVNLAGQLWAWLDEHAPWFTGFLRTVWDYIGKAWSWIVDMAGTAWTWLEEHAPWLTSILEALWGYLKTAWSWTLNMLGDAWAWLIGTSLAEKVQDIKGWFTDAWQWAIDAVGDAWSWLDERFPALTDALKLLWESFSRAWQWLINTAGDVWQWLVGTTWEQKWKDITSWLAAAWEWVINTAGVAWDWITGTTWKEKLADIKGWIAAAWQWVVNTGGTAWAWLDERFPALTGALRTVWSWFEKAWAWTVATAGAAWTWLDEKLGITVALQMVWDWLKKAWSWTLNVAGDAWDWLKNIFGWVGDKLETAWNWTLNFLGDAWDWLRDVAWPWLSKAANTAWNWTLSFLSDAWEWLRDVAWPWLSKAANTAWNWTLSFLGDAWEWLRDVAWPWLSKAASTAWAWTLSFLGDAWDWLRDVAWPWLSKAASTAWAWTLNFLGDAWDWLRDVAWPIIKEGAKTAWNWTVEAAGAVWDWLLHGGWQDTVQGIKDWFGSIPDAIIGVVLRIAQYIQALKDGFIKRFLDMKDGAIAAIQGIVEGVQEWFSETRMGKAFGWVGEQVNKVTGFFANMYDKVVGRSYVPDMVEEIGEAIERLKDRLANPVVRYTRDVILAFEDMEDEVVASMMSMAERLDDVLKTIVDRTTKMIGDVTRAFWNGTATWSNILHTFAGTIGSIFGTVFDAIAKELVSNLILQNEWIVSTLANIATTITAYLSQAFAALTAFYWFLGPGAPAAAAATIAAAIAAIAAIGGSLVRGVLPDAPGGGSPDVGTGDKGGGRPSGGRQVSEITGPTRDLLIDLLTPLTSLNTLTGIGERIYNLLDDRLPAPVGMQFAGAGAGGYGAPQITFEPGSVQVYPQTSSTQSITDDTVEEIERKLAERLERQIRGQGR